MVVNPQYEIQKKIMNSRTAMPFRLQECFSCLGKRVKDYDCLTEQVCPLCKGFGIVVRAKSTKVNISDVLVADTNLEQIRMLALFGLGETHVSSMRHFK